MKRLLIRLYEDTKWFNVIQSLFLVISIIILVMLLVLFFTPDSVSNYPYFKKLSENAALISSIGIIFSIVINTWAKFKVESIEHSNTTDK